MPAKATTPALRAWPPRARDDFAAAAGVHGRARDAIRQPGEDTPTYFFPAPRNSSLAGLAGLGVRRALGRHGFGFRELVVVVAAEEEEADRVAQEPAGP